LENRDWIRNFDSVVLWFDNDEPGKDAADKAAKIIGFDKVKVVKNTKYKDANELSLQQQIDQQINNPVVTPPLPWVGA